MKKRTFIAVAVTLLAGVQTAWAQPVTVKVGLVGRDIQVPEKVFVEERMGRGVDIRWELPPNADYRFDPPGIRIDGELVGSSLRPQNQVGGCGGGPKHVVCRNENSKKGEFKYTINLLGPDGKPISKDPIIVNR